MPLRPFPMPTTARGRPGMPPRIFLNMNRSVFGRSGTQERPGPAGAASTYIPLCESERFRPFPEPRSARGRPRPGPPWRNSVPPNSPRPLPGPAPRGIYVVKTIETQPHSVFVEAKWPPGPVTIVFYSIYDAPDRFPLTLCRKKQWKLNIIEVLSRQIGRQDRFLL